MSDATEPITMAALLKAANEMLYQRIPCEARLTADSMIRLRLIVAPDPFKPTPLPSPLDAIFGLRLIVDPTMAPNRIEFRDQKGEVISSFDLP